MKKENIDRASVSEKRPESRVDSAAFSTLFKIKQSLLRKLFKKWKNTEISERCFRNMQNNHS